MFLRSRFVYDLFLFAGVSLLMIMSPDSSNAQSRLTAADLERIGGRIWQNECAGSVDGLTSWNVGEDFASLGIGHFIWYPAGETGPFKESFPGLIAWLQQSSVTLPGWLMKNPDCPWPDRKTFIENKDSPWMKDLRKLLAATVSHQTQFIIARLNAAKPRLLAAAGPQAGLVSRNMELLSQTAAGNFAMIDYVNFKGEGLKPEERYNGQGWGLLQVLTEMQATSAGDAPQAFSTASKKVLTRRVENSPAERNERRWLEGWLNRCERYANPF